MTRPSTLPQILSSHWEIEYFEAIMIEHILSGSKEGGILSGVGELEDPLSRFFVQAVIIIGITRCLSLLGAYLKQPRVIFEVIGGIILGPSALGRIPNFLELIFPKASLAGLSLVANIGLTFYLFIVGMELEPKLLISQFQKAGAISIFGIVLPFGLGIAISRTMYDNLLDDIQPSFSAFFVFMGTAMSITAFPVLARILKESGMIYSKPGAIVMGAAAIDDACAWCLLILAISMAKAGDMATAGYVFLSVICTSLGLFTVVRIPFNWLVVTVEKKVEIAKAEGRSMPANVMSGNLFAFTILIMFMCAWTTALLGVHAIFGAFLFGLIIPRDSQLYQHCNHYIEDFVMTLMLPLYFAQSGLKTDISQIKSWNEGKMILLVCVIASAGKFIGCGGAAYASGMSFRESSIVAVLMNTRGLVELIVLNLGLDSGILNQKVFAVMVIMCLFTTFMTCPVIELIFPESIRAQYAIDAESPSVSRIKRKKSSYLPATSDEEISLELIVPSITDEINILVTLSKDDEIEGIMAVLSMFSDPNKLKKLSVAALKYCEPTHSVLDRFVVNDKGTLVEVRPLLTSLRNKPESTLDHSAYDLLPIAMFATTIGASNVSAFKMVGDTNEFGPETGDLCDSNNINLIVMKWTPTPFLEKLFWCVAQETSIPLALLVDKCNTDEPAKVISKVIVLLTGEDTDIVCLEIAKRISNTKGIQVTIVCPENKKDVFSSQLLDAYRTCKSDPSISRVKAEFRSDNFEAYGKFLATENCCVDMIICSFIVSNVTSPEIVAEVAKRRVSYMSSRGRSNSFAGTREESMDVVKYRTQVLHIPEFLASSCQQEYVELGSLGSFLMSNMKRGYLLVVHSQGISRVRRSSSSPEPMLSCRASVTGTTVEIPGITV